VRITDEIRASAEAHRDLGPNYDTAVAEGLVERIGEEIDKRIDARMYGYPPGQPGYPPSQQGQPPVQPGYPQAQRPAPMPPLPPPAPQPRAPGRIGAGQVIMALGSMALAIGATAAVLHPANGAQASAAVVALIWVVIGIINVAYARRR
jgi:hypothetical protein